MSMFEKVRETEGNEVLQEQKELQNVLQERYSHTNKEVVKVKIECDTTTAETKYLRCIPMRQIVPRQVKASIENNENSMR